MLRRRDGLRGPCQQELDDRRGSALEICRAVRVACLDALEHETVEQGEDAAGHGVDIERGGQLTIDDSLAEQQLNGTPESLAASRQHLPDSRPPGWARGEPPAPLGGPLLGPPPPPLGRDGPARARLLIRRAFPRWGGWRLRAAPPCWSPVRAWPRARRGREPRSGHRSGG